MSRRVKVCSVMLWSVFCAQAPFAQSLAAPAPAPAAQAPAAPAPAATLDAVQIPPGPHPETLLHVQAPGRFALRTQSPSGTALELIDMVTGPTRTEGEPGAKDGRLDLLLDQGTYKVRLHPAPNAAAPIHLAVTPFTDAAPPATLEPDSEAHATLADFQQRSVWFAVAANSPPIRLEAAGRALADLQLWRNGRDLVPITPTADTTIEPTKLHPLHDILIAQSLPPGTYLATAYGGPALPWADGATAMPFHIRLGAAQTLRPGWVAATVGPFGSALYNTVGSDDLVRLSMAGPATLQVDSDSTAIDRKSRVPEATLETQSQALDHLVEVQGPEGTPYRLRSTRIGQGTTESRAGTYWVTGNTDGLGGDNVPATLILALRDRGSFTVLGSNAPEIGPRTAWRRRFSMGAETSILFHVEAGGMVAAALTGLATLPPTVAALDTERDVPPPDPAHPAQWDLAPGWYALSVMPAHGAAGVADLTIGPPGVTVPPGPPGPPSPSITFGAQTVGYRQSLVLLGNAAAGSRLGLEARPFPVDLGSTPLRVSQEPGAALRIPVVQHAWPPQAVEINRGPVPVQTPTPTTVELPPADHPRTVALLQSAPRPAGPPPVPAPDSARPSLQDGTPAFFDFAEATPRAFSLAVAKGGLFHVETLGRLRTRSAIGTHFVPELASADADGPGQNALLQTFLRAGAYHVDVTAEASSGHAGIVAFPAPLLASPSLLPGGTIRATLPPGSGLAVPLEIAAQGTYRLDLLGLNRTFTARLEDAEGWPLAVSAPLSTVTQDLSPGTYRLLVMPQPTAARAVARLIRIEPAAARTGHGPFPLPFEQTQAYTWREPPGRDDPRVPDRWRFTLAAPADVTLDLGDGMQADLLRDGGPAPVAHLAGGTPLARTLPPGNYTLEATSQGRNDRLGYTIGLSATQLQPGIPRAVTLPGSASFALAAPRIVSLTSFGATPVRATLKASDGHVIARIGARQNDWNLALSRLLPAGTYTLDAADAAPPPQQPTPPNPNDQPAPSADAPDGAPADAPADMAGGAPNEAATDESGAAADAPSGAAPDSGPDTPADAEPAPRTPNASGPDQDNAAAPPPSGTTELTLALPADAPPATLVDGAATLTGGGVHHLPLPPAAPNQLILAGAASTEAAVISLEQQTPAGGWQSRAQAQGLAPILAMQPDATPGAWRLSVWPVDGGALPIRAAARIVDDAAAEGQPHLRRTPLPGVAPALCTAHVQAPAGRPLLHLQGKGAILAATWPGHEAAAPNANLIAPQGPDFWLIAHGPGAMALSPAAPAAPLAITLARGETATLPSPANTLAAWIAEGQGQPGLAGNSAMGVTDDAALVLSTGAPVTLWNAGDDDTLRIAAKAVTLIQAPSQPSEGDHILPPASATPIAMPPGAHTIRLDLPPGTAMVAAGTPAAAAAAPAAPRRPRHRLGRPNNHQPHHPGRVAQPPPHQHHPGQCRGRPGTRNHAIRCGSHARPRLQTLLRHRRRLRPPRHRRPPARP